MVVAAAIFVVSVLVLFGIFPITARSVHQAEERLMASHLAENRLELCRSTAYLNLKPLPPELTTVIFRHQGELVTQEYSVEQRVTPIGTPDRLRNVEVIVSWKSNNRTQELRLETQFASLSP